MRLPYFRCSLITQFVLLCAVLMMTPRMVIAMEPEKLLHDVKDLDYKEQRDYISALDLTETDAQSLAAFFVNRHTIEVDNDPMQTAKETAFIISHLGKHGAFRRALKPHLPHFLDVLNVMFTGEPPFPEETMGRIIGATKYIQLVIIEDAAEIEVPLLNTLRTLARKNNPPQTMALGGQLGAMITQLHVSNDVLFTEEFIKELRQILITNENALAFMTIYIPYATLNLGGGFDEDLFEYMYKQNSALPMAASILERADLTEISPGFKQFLLELLPLDGTDEDLIVFIASFFHAENPDLMTGYLARIVGNPELKKWKRESYTRTMKKYGITLEQAEEEDLTTLKQPSKTEDAEQESPEQAQRSLPEDVTTLLTWEDSHRSPDGRSPSTTWDDQRRDKALDDLLSLLKDREVNLMVRFNLKDTLIACAGKDAKWLESMQRHVPSWRSASKRLPDPDDRPFRQNMVLRDSFDHFELLAVAKAITHQDDAEAFLQLMAMDRFGAAVYHHRVAKAFVPWTLHFEQRYVDTIFALHAVHPRLIYTPLRSYIHCTEATERKLTVVKRFIRDLDITQNEDQIVGYLKDLPDPQFIREADFMWDLPKALPRAKRHMWQVYIRLATIDEDRAMKNLAELGLDQSRDSKHAPVYILQAMLDLNHEHQAIERLVQGVNPQHTAQLEEAQAAWVRRQANTNN